MLGRPFAEDDERADDFSLFAADGGGGIFDWRGGSLRAGEEALGRAENFLLDIGFAQRAGDTISGVAMQQAENLRRAALHGLIEAPAGEFFGAGVHEEDIAATIRHEQSVRHGVESVGHPKGNSGNSSGEVGVVERERGRATRSHTNFFKHWDFQVLQYTLLDWDALGKGELDDHPGDGGAWGALGNS